MSTEMLIEMGRIEVAATAIYVTVCGLDRRAIYRDMIDHRLRQSRRAS